MTTGNRRRVFVSIGTRLTILVITLVTFVAIGVYVGLVRTFGVDAKRSKALAVDMVVALTSASVTPAVVFGDEAEIDRAIKDLARNPEVTDVELWSAEAGAELQGADGSPHPLGSFHREGGRPLGRPSAARSERIVEPDSIRAVEPVTSLEGRTIAVLVVRFSTRREAAAQSALAREILYVSTGTALCIAVAILLVLQGMVVLPLKRLQTDASRLAKGELIEKGSARRTTEDEVVQLATAFGDMAQAVYDRETRLAVRNAELRIILDSVDQGFLSAGPDGVLMPERSAVVRKWLGDLDPKACVWDLTARLDPKSRAWTEAAWSQLVEGILPTELALAQLPKRLTSQGRHFALGYHPVMTGDHIERIVIVLTDVTAEVERQQALAEQQELSALVDQFVRDRRAFLGFWNEASALVSTIVEDPLDKNGSVLREIHTLKGNARFFGLTRLSVLCHSLEDALAERGETVLTAEERASLREAWDALGTRMEPLLRGANAFVEISKDEYDQLLDTLHRRAPLETVEGLLRGLRQEPTAWRLERARDTVVAACRKLGKPLPNIVLNDNHLRLDPGRLAPFWSVFSHVLANAVDHGLELSDERSKAGKQETATIEISTRAAGSDLLIEVADDGRGIDWSRVRVLAEARGLPCRTREELVNALLSEGFSLRQEVTEVSGRGMGLAAVRNVVASLGGRIEIESWHGKGTKWRFRFGAGNEPPSTATIGNAPVAARFNSR